MQCQVGDIIVVSNYMSHGKPINGHSFVVLSTEHGKIQGLDYDLVCNVMSSFHSEEHRRKKLGYPGNFEYPADQENVKNGHGRAGFIKAEQFYYFDSEKTDFYVIGNITSDLLDDLLLFIDKLKEVEHIIDNL